MIFEKIYDPANLKKAWTKVRAAKSPPGIDRMGRDAFEKNLNENLALLEIQLREETYHPLPVVVFDKQKSTGSRTIGISTIRDKIVQQAVVMGMGPGFELEFLPCSFAYRPGKSALTAVKKADELIRSGKLWALQMDIASFFDTMDHDILLDLIRRVLDEKPLLRLITRLLKARIFREMGLFDNLIGSGQGSGLSPLLSNIYMHPADVLLYRKYKDRYLRYSDDVLVFADEQEQLIEIREIVTRCLAELKLAVNEDKTAIRHVSAGITYLGYYLDTTGKGPDQKSVHNLENRLKGFDKIRKTDDIDGKLDEIKTVVRGWLNYYQTLKPVTPPNVMSLIVLADLAWERGETGLAKDLLKQFKRFEHNHPQLILRIGDLFNALGMQKQAIREYARALELDPTMNTAKEKLRALQETGTDIHGAIENLQIVLHHNPGFREGYDALARHYSELGLFGFAEQAQQKALNIDEDGEKPADTFIKTTPAPDFDYRAIDQEIFLNLFEGRKNAYAKQWVDERGRWGFIRVDRSLGKKDVFKHLNGEVTIGVYPVMEDMRVRFIVFDVDTSRRRLLESDPGDVERFRDKAHIDILRIKSTCVQLGLDMYIEDSGYKGRHGWLFFDAPVLATRAVLLGREIMRKAGGPSADMIWELFPMGKSEIHLSVIKLPLGVNRKNNRRCLFLTDANAPAPDQAMCLKIIRKNDPSIAERLPDEPGNATGLDGIENPAFMRSLSAGLSDMCRNCKIIDRLVRKVKETNYLNHFERIVLLYTLTFAGEEGVNFLHTVMGYCINYDRQITQKQINCRKNSPISCAKIGEYFPELVQSHPCDCHFDIPSRGYPSPTLYLLKTEIAEAMTPPLTHAPTPDTAKPEPEEETKLLDFSKIFADEMPKKQATQGPMPVDNHTPSNLPAPALVSEALPDIKTEQVQQVDQRNHMVHETANAPEPSRSEPEPNNAWALAIQYLGLLSDHDTVNRELTRVKTLLDEMFEDERQTIQTRFGCIRRIKKGYFTIETR